MHGQCYHEEHCRSITASFQNISRARSPGIWPILSCRRRSPMNVDSRRTCADVMSKIERKSINRQSLKILRPPNNCTHQWCSGNINAFQAFALGSIPGWCSWSVQLKKIETYPTFIRRLNWTNIFVLFTVLNWMNIFVLFTVLPDVLGIENSYVLPT